jgi:hypothetical protein
MRRMRITCASLISSEQATVWLHVDMGTTPIFFESGAELIWEKSVAQQQWPHGIACVRRARR